MGHASICITYAAHMQQTSFFFLIFVLCDFLPSQLTVGEWDVKKEAAWVVSNIATGGSHEQVFALVKNHKPVEPLCSLLDVQDGKLLMVTRMDIDDDDDDHGMWHSWLMLRA